MNIRKAATEAARIIRRGNRANVMADGTVWESVGPFGLIDRDGHQTHPIWYNRTSSPCQGLTIADITRMIREATIWHARDNQETARTVIVGEYRQQDGWHIARVFDSPAAAREWINRVDESEGHHHARRFRRIRRDSHAYSIALEADAATRNA